ncbi:hypothetical protein HanRHA438_Chr16g0769831 [Helianthus annuus]|nr:hypothetical protein HanRHA438_Chr16g0769831 [Helianthus annuus]
MLLTDLYPILKKPLMFHPAATLCSSFLSNRSTILLLHHSVMVPDLKDFINRLGFFIPLVMSVTHPLLEILTTPFKGYVLL